MPSSNSLLRVFRQTDDNTSLYVVTFQEASYQKQSLLQQHGKFKKMKSLSHMSPYLRPTSESLRIVVAQSCYEFVTSCRFISLYRQAHSLFPIFLCTGLLEALTYTLSHAHMHSIFPLLGISIPKIQSLSLFCFFPKPKPKVSLLSANYKTEIETLVSTYVNSFFLSLSTAIRFAQCQI